MDGVSQKRIHRQLADRLNWTRHIADWRAAKAARIVFRRVLPRRPRARTFSSVSDETDAAWLAVERQIREGLRLE